MVNKEQLLSLIFLTQKLALARVECDPVELSNGIVCKCDSTYCDDFDPPASYAADQIVIYTSSEAGKRLDQEVLTLAESASAPLGTHTIQLDGNSYQTVLGFGGAFTDAAAYVVSFLPQSAQDYFYSSYYSRTNGAAYSMGRVPIGGADFSRETYSLIEDNDFTLETFAIMDDDLIPGKDYKLDMIQRAKEEIEATSQGMEEEKKSLDVFGSVWSGPVHFKTCESPPAPEGTNSCEETSYLFGGLNASEEIRDLYANYILMFIEAYEERGVILWGLTAQNEPDGNPTTNKWNNMNFSPEDLVDFVEHHLGPVVKEKYPDIKIMVGDDQYPFMPEYTEAIEETSAQYIDGLGYHWYFSFAGSLIGTGPVLLVTDLIGGQIEVRNAYDEFGLDNAPSSDGFKFLLMTEACTGYLDNIVEPGSWERGYNYFTSILHELESGSAGWVDWNLALDMSGGPNWANNQVDAPILVDTEEGIFYKQPMYYAMAHFSAFIPPGAVRLGIQDTDIGFIGWFKDLEVVAFRKSATSEECIMIIANDHLIASQPTRGVSADERARLILPQGQITIDIFDNEFKTILFNCPL
eukprot:snap_masked-scaffold_6-processed-gene-12.14-mRNA-1 protein AED:0.02 eAED:0.02 QI:0/-1/0/1/-1/1/1/0/578